MLDGNIPRVLCSPISLWISWWVLVSRSGQNRWCIECKLHYFGLWLKLVNCCLSEMATNISSQWLIVNPSTEVHLNVFPVLTPQFQSSSVLFINWLFDSPQTRKQGNNQTVLGSNLELQLITFALGEFFLILAFGCCCPTSNLKVYWFAI